MYNCRVYCCIVTVDIVISAETPPIPPSSPFCKNTEQVERPMRLDNLDIVTTQRSLRFPTFKSMEPFASHSIVKSPWVSEIGRSQITVHHRHQSFWLRAKTAFHLQSRLVPYIIISYNIYTYDSLATPSYSAYFKLTKSILSVIGNHCRKCADDMQLIVSYVGSM